MDSRYNHQKYEQGIYERWEKARLFEPSGHDSRPFTIIMPPPNANDPLHIGHAREVATQDILIRYHRMKGDKTLWLPGADHAGIETQFVFEKKLQKKGKSRFDYDRATLYRMIWEDVQKQSTTMKKQLRRLGASCDWSRFKFTLDPDIVALVLKTFKKLHEDGLVYREAALVNYCPECGTAFSNLEVEHKEVADPWFEIKYGPFVVGTVRPETKFRDTALAVNPKDKRYNKYIGKTITVEGLLGPVEMTVIPDPQVDPKFGTGIMKVTPAHDPHDFELGKEHKLPVAPIIDFDGKMDFSWYLDSPEFKNEPKKYRDRAEKYHGLPVKKMRTVMRQDLEEDGLLVSYNPNYRHTIAVCYRCRTPIEPLPMEQWYIKVQPLAKKALAAIKSGKVGFPSKQFERRALHWLENLKDWNISRQIVWGIQIPAWKCEDCGEWAVTDGEKPKKCQCGSTKLTKDTDTFDTWFSSSQWPFVTLQTAKKGDFEKFYPTSVMNPAYEILMFWVLRMIMLGLYMTGQVPFRTALLHGLVRDKQGLKISKSKGNVIDPIEMADKYGADALRVALVWGTKVEHDNSLSEDNIRGQRNFSNKLWNVGRFVLSNKSNSRHSVPNLQPSKIENSSDRKIISELEGVTKNITSHLDNYSLNEAAEELYDFVWNRLANDYLEIAKARRKDAQPVLEYVLAETLKLAHPFVPFVTEAIWQQGFAKSKTDFLAESKWPSNTKP